MDINPRTTGFSWPVVNWVWITGQKHALLERGAETLPHMWAQIWPRSPLSEAKIQARPHPFCQSPEVLMTADSSSYPVHS